MKPSLAILILIIGLLSCKDDELPLTPGLVEEIKAYDLDNNGNASDIRLSFTVRDNLNVIGYRVMIIPSNQINSIDEGLALSVPSTSYIEFLPESFEIEYSIMRLPSSMLDINGGQIQNEIEYVATVFVIGIGHFQLSTFSTPFILKDRGIYSGRYVVKWSESNCADGDELNENIVDLLGIENSYSGKIKQVIRGNPYFPLGTVNFSVSGTTITDYVNDDPDFNFTSSIENFCHYTSVGTGNIIDELILEVNTSIVYLTCGKGCVGNRIFIRQG